MLIYIKKAFVMLRNKETDTGITPFRNVDSKIDTKMTS